MPPSVTADWLNRWISKYVERNPATATEIDKAKHPLAAAEVVRSDVEQAIAAADRAAAHNPVEWIELKWTGRIVGRNDTVAGLIQSVVQYQRLVLAAIGKGHDKIEIDEATDRIEQHGRKPRLANGLAQLGQALAPLFQQQMPSGHGQTLSLWGYGDNQ